MPNRPSDVKLVHHLASEENELEDVERKLNDAEDKDRDVAVRLRNSINHIEKCRQGSERVAEEIESETQTLRSELIDPLIKNIKGTITEIEESKEEVQEVLLELNKAESELEDVLEKAETDKEAIMSIHDSQ